MQKNHEALEKIDLWVRGVFSNLYFK